MDSAELKGALEAIIYAADEPATLDQLVEATGAERNEVLAALDEMIGTCGADERGIEIRKVARGYRYSTKARHHEVVRKFIKNLRPPVRLSMPALETLAVIAYRQPITLPEIQEVRGVNSSGVIQTLLDKRLVTTAGRKAVIGRPILYRTTKEFLIRFGLEDVDDLPSLKDFEQLAREALGPDAGIELELAPVSEDEAAAEPPAEPGGASLPETPEGSDAETSEASAALQPEAGPQTLAEEDEKKAEPVVDSPVVVAASATAEAAPSEAEPKPEPADTSPEEGAPSEESSSS